MNLYADHTISGDLGTSRHSRNIFRGTVEDVSRCKGDYHSPSCRWFVTLVLDSSPSVTSLISFCDSHSTKSFLSHDISLTRPSTDWLKSISTTVGRVLKWRAWPLISWADPALTKPWHVFMHYTDLHLSFWTSACSPQTRHITRAAYLAHYANLQSLLRHEDSGRTLYLKPGGEWQELCAFLGKQVPTLSEAVGEAGVIVQYPKLNDAATYVAFHEAMWRRAMSMAVRKLAFVIIAATLLLLLLFTMAYWPW